MQITLKQSEIEEAIIAYVGNQGISITGKNVAVSLVAGRAPNGMSACIDISNDDEPTTVLDISDMKPEKVEKPGLTFNKPVAENSPINEETTPAEKPLFGKE